MIQYVGRGKLKNWQGALIIALAVAGVYALNFLFGLVSLLGVPEIALTVGLWAGAFAIAAWLFHRYALVYVYQVGTVKASVSRIYLKNPRLAEEFLLREIAFVGTPEEAKKRFPGTRVRKAVSVRETAERVAVVYRRSGEAKTLILQPNAEIYAALQNVAKR